MINIDQVKILRDSSGISIAQCKKALEEAEGDIDKAMELLKAQGAFIADKKSSRSLSAGKIGAYIHSDGRMGALIEVHSETDFVAKNAEFQALVDDLAMHITAMNPIDKIELLEQSFIKDQALTVNDLVKSHIQKFGERIEIIRFVRFDTSLSSE